MKQYTLEQLEKEFNIPIRKAAYLVRNGVIEPLIEGGKLLIPEEEFKKYLNLPKPQRQKYHASYLKTLGPGIITGASDDDPSGIATYSIAGAAYGLNLSWMAVYLLPMMSAVQETCARIGIVTGKGLSGAISKHYGKKFMYPLVLLLFIANTVNIGADIGAMAASLQMLIPASFYILAITLTGIMLFLEIKFSYRQYSKVLKWLCLSLFAYIITGIVVKPDWLSVFNNMTLPRITFDKGYIATMVAIMGTTISPYLFFWQTSEEVEEEKDKGVYSDHRKLAIKREIKEMRQDTYTGMSLSNIVFLFIVITTATVLFKEGGTTIESASDAAEALRPLAGNFTYFLFTIGILGTGLLAVPVLASASSYAISELFKWHEGISQKFTKARGFYGVIIFSLLIGLAMNFLNINPFKSLYYAAILNGLSAPILMYSIFSIGRNKQIMGDFTSPRWVNIWGGIATILMSLGAAALVLLSIFGG